MTEIVGGLRARLVRESLFQMLKNALDDLGWFDSGRQHAPIDFRSEEVTDRNAIPVNTAALADFDTSDDSLEMGSALTQVSWRFYVDMFGESDALSLHFCRDIKDILQGRMPSIGRGHPDFEVYDYRQATPSLLFYCQLDGVLIDRPIEFTKPFDKFWRTVRFDVLDDYGREDD